ncbi:RluA family pseudouridine synthase [Polaromonas sp.]|uniref:RluA family pseudouridine synthase n=1 Tax=Polaromonas sp. TaxID=1869339 RepID=UPI0039C959DB
MKHIIGAGSGKTRRPGKPREAPELHRPPPSAGQVSADPVRNPPADQLVRSIPEASFVTVDPDLAGQRLDNFLIRLLKGVPKTHVYRIIRSGEVRVNKGRAQADTRIEAGDSIRLPPVRTSERADEKARAMAVEIARDGAASTVGGYAPSREFPILFEDEHVLAIDKPAGVAVHGGSGVAFGVIEQLRMARPEAKFLELVHRLDRETSGILLVAKKRMALKNLQEQFRERETDKIYLALVSGAWPGNKKVLDKPLQKYLLPDGERRVRVVDKDHPDAMRAVTLVKVQSAVAMAGRAFSLLEVTIKTGRTHQIRVHLASEGHPIAGDDKYGDFDLNKALQKEVSGACLKRMFLHAWRLKFTHPSSGKRIELLAVLPPDLESLAAHAITA